MAAHDAAIQSAIARHYAADLAWLEELQSVSSADSQNDTNSLAIQALDAAFAEYGQE